MATARLFFLPVPAKLDKEQYERGVNAMQLTQPPTPLGGMDAREERPVVLVIDDHPAILDMLAIALTLQGYQSVCVTNGEEALEVDTSTRYI